MKCEGKTDVGPPQSRTPNGKNQLIDIKKIAATDKKKEPGRFYLSLGGGGGGGGISTESLESMKRSRKKKKRERAHCRIILSDLTTHDNILQWKNKTNMDAKRNRGGSGGVSRKRFCKHTSSFTTYLSGLRTIQIRGKERGQAC